MEKKGKGKSGRKKRGGPDGEGLRKFIMPMARKVESKFLVYKN